MRLSSHCSSKCTPLDTAWSYPFPWRTWIQERCHWTPWCSSTKPSDRLPHIYHSAPTRLWSLKCRLVVQEENNLCRSDGTRCMHCMKSQDGALMRQAEAIKLRKFANKYSAVVCRYANRVSNIKALWGTQKCWKYSVVLDQWKPRYEILFKNWCW